MIDQIEFTDFIKAVCLLWMASSVCLTQHINLMLKSKASYIFLMGSDAIILIRHIFINGNIGCCWHTLGVQT